MPCPDFDIEEHYPEEMADPWVRRCYEYFACQDTQFVAHRSLLKDCVPGWVRSKIPFTEGLESFSYGDTPAPVMMRLLRRLGAVPRDRFLDLGCGCGSAALTAAGQLASVRGVDLVPAVVDFAREAARNLGAENAEFELADVRECDPQRAEVIYLAWTSFTPELREAVGHRLTEMARGGRVVTVTHPLELEEFESLGREDCLFSWNGEYPIIPYTFYLYRRT